MPTEELRIGVFVCECGSNIGGVVDTQALCTYAAALPNVVAAVRNKYTCADPGQQEIQRIIYEHNLNRVVVASCSPASYESVFRQCIGALFLTPPLTPCFARGRCVAHAAAIVFVGAARRRCRPEGAGGGHGARSGNVRGQTPRLGRAARGGLFRRPPGAPTRPLFPQRLSRSTVPRRSWPDL